jgi:hypothetical protein
MNEPREVQIVLVPVPVPVPAAGAPKEAHRQPPPAYPRNSREAWRPPTRPPSKAERLGRFLDSINQQEAALREMLTPSPKAWFDLPGKDAGA